MRHGIGYDIHRLIPTVKPASIPIGGVSVPCYYKTQAHSDGDVLLHALTDACLGALALGDIGQWYSDSAPENQGRSSSDFLRGALRELNRLGWRIVQLDTNVFLEEPKLAPQIDEIRQTIAKITGLELACVSVKAKTMEGLGPVGERKAIAAQAVVCIEELPR